MDYVGFDKDNNKLHIGDICKFTIDRKEYEGMIMYDEDIFAYVFEMKDDKFPCVVMYKTDLCSIKKICGVYSTKLGDEFEFYREIYNKRLNN